MIREAKSVCFPSDQDGEQMFLTVGGTFWTVTEGKSIDVGPILRITVEDDLPGLHCNMERVKVWVCDKMILEAPVISVLWISYP